MKNKIISILLFLCAIVCTMVIYHLIFDEHSTLFYINVIIACVAEIILLFNISVLSSKRLLTFKNSATTIILNIYALVLFLWTSIFSLYVEKDSDYKTLYVGILVSTVVFIVMSAMVEIGGNIMQKEEKKLLQTQKREKEFRLYIETYRLELSDILLNIDSELKTDNFSLLEIVLEKVSICPSEKIEQNVIDNIKEKLEDIKKMYKEFLNDNRSESLHGQLSQKIKSLNNYINVLKSTL